MGRNARQRDARQRDARKGHSQHRCPPQPSTGVARPDRRRLATAEALVVDAVSAQDHRHLAAVADRLVATPGARDALERFICIVIERKWDDGWQPRDLARVFARERNAADRGWLVAAIAVESRSYLGSAVVDRGWRAQLVDIGAHDSDGPTASSILDWSPDARVQAVVLAVARLRWLFALPALPRIAPPPSEWTTPTVEPGARPADAIVAKVRALLAKAESTDYPAEAESLTAKAQELITRHAIDRVLLAEEGDGAPVARRVPIDEPYAEARAQLLTAIARANGCRTVRSDRLGFSTVFGFADDVDTVELLHASLLVQAMRALAVAGRDASPGAQTRSRAYRRAFLLGFAAQIGQRLRETAERETAAAAEREGPSLLPVLASRERQVGEELARVFPHLVSGRRVTFSDGQGYAAGRAAARVAHLGLDPTVAPPLQP
jgi:hypothetical protein